MNRPVTPENKSEIYRDSTICTVKRPVTVRIVDSTLPAGVHCPAIKENPYHKLPAGSIVTVLGSRTLNFTGVNDTQSTTNTAYRIEGEIEATVYEEVLNPTSSQPFKLLHSNLRPVVRRDLLPENAYSSGTIVSLKQDVTYNKSKMLPKGELFITVAEAETPRGQPHRFRDPINGALYQVKRVRKNIYRFKVKNSTDVLVMHDDLERVTRVQ